MSHSSQLPPLKEGLNTGSSQKFKGGGDAVINDYQLKFEHLKKENELMRKHKEDSEESYKKMM